MNGNRHIDVKHLARIEGHGDIHIAIENGRLKEARWTVVETPRFFEAMLKGVPHDLAPLLSARICGICSISHTLASLRAVERALGIEVPPAARRLRLLAKHGETLQSHFLHLYFLAAPDYFGTGSVLPLIGSHPEIVACGLRLKHLANTLCDRVAGRTTHPVNLCVGGVGRGLTASDLRELQSGLTDALTDLDRTVELFAGLPLPAFQRETEYVSLRGESTYPWIGGRLMSSDGVEQDENAYRAMTNEYVPEVGTSKLARLSRASYAVGSLARFNNNFACLSAPARQTAAALGLQPPVHNPFACLAAQVVECVEAAHGALAVIEELLSADGGALRVAYALRAGDGVGAVEAPRGILYHHLTLDADGRVATADCIIPTTQNNANIHRDLAALVGDDLAQGQSTDETVRRCEMLVRAYDPCLSCAVH